MLSDLLNTKFLDQQRKWRCVLAEAYREAFEEDFSQQARAMVQTALGVKTTCGCTLLTALSALLHTVLSGSSKVCHVWPLVVLALCGSLQSSSHCHAEEDSTTALEGHQSEADPAPRPATMAYGQDCPQALESVTISKSAQP